MHKKLTERKNELIAELGKLTATIQTEERAFNEDEKKRYDEIKAEIVSINDTLTSLSEMRDFTEPVPAAAAAEPKKETTEESEIREFAQYIRTLKAPETRANEQNFTMSANGAIVPTTIAQMVIKKATDLCPILSGATIFHVKGTLKIPVYGPDATHSNDVTVGYSSEFTELTANAGEFTSVDLTGYLIRSLTLIGKALLNSADVQLVSFVTDVMAEKFANFIEKELLNGTTSKCTGALSTGTGITAAAKTAITADELIKLQASIKQTYQRNACWTMSAKTFTAIKTLKDGNNRYLFQDDVTQEFPYRLLGKPVYISDNMPEIAADAKPILYGDYSGLAVNIRDELSIEVLKEHFATQHAVGIIGWIELDSKIMDAQRLAVLKMAASS